jgi:hypothetical protein
MPGVEFPCEICTRRLPDLISAAQLTVFAFQLGDPLLILGRGAGPLPRIDIRLIHPVAERLGVDAKPMADPRAFPVSACNSKTICTARSRSSAGCGFLDTMSPYSPRGHSLQGTRGDPFWRLSVSPLLRVDVLAHCPLCHKRGDCGQGRWQGWPA